MFKMAARSEFLLGVLILCVIHVVTDAPANAGVKCPLQKDKVEITWDKNSLPIVGAPAFLTQTLNFSAVFSPLNNDLFDSSLVKPPPYWEAMGGLMQPQSKEFISGEEIALEVGEQTIKFPSIIVQLLSFPPDNVMVPANIIMKGDIQANTTVKIVRPNHVSLDIVTKKSLKRGDKFPVLVFMAPLAVFSAILTEGNSAEALPPWFTAFASRSSQSDRRAALSFWSFYMGRYGHSATTP